MTSFIQTLIIATSIAVAVNAFGTEQKKPTSSTSNPAVLVFKPKNIGAPKSRVRGGSRGKNQSDVELTVLAPEQTGFTTHSQPTLYWWISKPVIKPIEITVTDIDSVLLKTNLDGMTKVGIQTLNLADHKIQLLPDIKYKWSVAIVNNTKQRSADTFTSAGIMRVPETQELKIRLASEDDKGRAIIYAGEGIWYDALAAIQTLVDKTSGEEIPVAMRTSLLQQVGLSDQK